MTRRQCSDLTLVWLAAVVLARLVGELARVLLG